MKETQHTKEMVEDDEITLKELILKLQEYFWEVWDNKKLLFLIPIPVVLFMLYQAFTTPKIYPATLTFMVNEDEGGGIGGMGALLGQVLGGGAAGGKYNLDKMLELARSRKIIEQVLFEKVKVLGQEDYVANHLIKVYDLHGQWAEEENEALKDFLFSNANANQLKPLEQIVLKILYGRILGNKRLEGLMNTSYVKETGIMSISVKTESEEFSIALAEAVFQKLSSYYINKAVEKQRKTYDVIVEKVDSIRLILERKQYALAHFKDSNRGLFTAKAQLSEMQLTQEVKALGLIYEKSLENLEVADFSLKIKTPFVQLIDAPVAPIAPVIKSKLMAIVFGSILGVGLAGVFIIARKIYRDAIKE